MIASLYHSGSEGKEFFFMELPGPGKYARRPLPDPDARSWRDYAIDIAFPRVGPELRQFVRASVQDPCPKNGPSHLGHHWGRDSPPPESRFCNPVSFWSRLREIRCWWDRNATRCWIAGQDFRAECNSLE